MVLVSCIEMGQCLSQSRQRGEPAPDFSSETSKTSTSTPTVAADQPCSEQPCSGAVSSRSRPFVMKQVMALMQELGGLEPGCRDSMVQACEIIQKHTQADTVSICACPLAINACVLTAAVGVGAQLLQQHAVMMDDRFSPFACVNQQAAGSSGCSPLACSINDASAAALQGLPLDWQLLATAAGMRCFLTLELTGADGNAVGTLSLASSNPAAFDQTMCFDSMLATASAGLASTLNLAHPVLAGACDLVALLVADREKGFKTVAASLLKGVQQLLLDTANIECGVRLGLLDRSTDTVVVLSRPDECRRLSIDAQGQRRLLHMTRMPAASSLLRVALSDGRPRFVADSTDPATSKSAGDLFVDPDELVTSLVLVPFEQQQAGARFAAGLYITHAQQTDFKAIKAAILSTTALLQPVVKDVLLQEGAVAAAQKEAVQVRGSELEGGGTLTSSASGEALPWTTNVVQMLQQRVRDAASRALPSQQCTDPEAAFLTDIRFGSVLGTGGFGTVYKGAAAGLDKVAIKVMYVPSAHRSVAKNTMEMAVVESIRHPNIVSVFKVLPDLIEDRRAGPNLSAPDGSFPPSSSPQLLRFRPVLPCDQINSITCNLVVMELCDKGALRTALRLGALHRLALAGPDQRLALVPCLTKLLLVLLEVANALAYCHALGIIHCDVKPENVMLKSSPTALGFTTKLCDFGLVKLLGKDRLYLSNHSCSGTAAYLAPERLEAGTKITAAVDVFSFGVMMFELFTRRSPMPHGWSVARFVASVAQGWRPQFPPGCPARYEQLARACWAHKAEQRPSSGQVATELKNMLAAFGRVPQP